MLVREIPKQDAQERLLKKYWLQRTPMERRTLLDKTGLELVMFTDLTVIIGEMQDEEDRS